MTSGIYKVEAHEEICLTGLVSTGCGLRQNSDLQGRILNSLWAYFQLLLNAYNRADEKKKGKIAIKYSTEDIYNP